MADEGDDLHATPIGSLDIPSGVPHACAAPDVDENTDSANIVGATEQANIIYSKFGIDEFNAEKNSDTNAGYFGPLNAFSRSKLARGIFDRDTMQGSSHMNPMWDYTYVFAPYCTGDLHSGLKPSDVSSTFRTPAAVADAATRITPAHFVGASNFLQMASYVQSKVFANPAMIVLAGESAGGFGTYLNYQMLRRVYTSSNIPITVISDSSPPPFTGTDDGRQFTSPGFNLKTALPYPQASYDDDAWADAWNYRYNVNIQNVTPRTSTLASGPMYSQSDIYKAATAVRPTQDKFGLIVATDDPLLPGALRLQTNGQSPNVNDLANQFVISIQNTRSNVRSLRISATNLSPLAGALLPALGAQPWNAHHTFLTDDVQTWGPLPNGSGVLNFLTDPNVGLGITP
jgi:hypothetical protein